MSEQQRRELTFEIEPVASGEDAEQSLTTMDYEATVESVSYIPNGRLIFWNDDEVHLGRDVSLSIRNQGSGKGTRRDVMVAWDEDSRSRPVIEAREELELPILTEGKIPELHEGDELYWDSKSIDKGDTEGEPGGILKVTLVVS